MSKRRKPPSRNPSGHAGGDTLTVIYPGLDAMPPAGTDLLAWCEEHKPPIRHDEVTRDEFQRRMAGNPVLDQLHESGRDTRVISLMETTALAQWLATSTGEDGPPEAECRFCRQRIKLLGGAWTDPDGAICCYNNPTSASYAPHRPEG